MEINQNLGNTQQGAPQVAPPLNAGVSPAPQVDGGGSSPNAASVPTGSQGGPNPSQAQYGYLRRNEERTTQRLASIENTLAQLASFIAPRQAQNAPAAQQQADLFTDPQAWQNNFKAELLQQVKQETQVARTQARLDVEGRMAQDMLKSATGNSPEAMEEIGRIAVANGYHYIERENPLLAAENAIRDWKNYRAAQGAQKPQVAPQQQSMFQQNPPPTRAMAAAINGNATPPTNRVWNAQAIADARRNGTYTQFKNEIWAQNGMKTS